MKTIPMLAALCLALTGQAAAQFTPMATAAPDSVPAGMNYQGRLEKDGFPVTGARTMAFRLYNAATGGTALYDSGNMSVTVQQGIFAVSLDIPFGALTGTAQKYLELEVEGIVLTPRDALRSVPYAKVAETVEGTINISTAGLTFTTNVGDSFAISSGSGRVGIGTGSPAARLHISSGAGETGTILLVSTGASVLATVDGNGVMTANHFVGDGTNLRNVVRRSGDSMSGSLTLVGSTLTVLGSGFSVAGTEFTVGAGRTGVGTAAPLAALSVVGDSSFSQPATFLSSVTVRDAAKFGSGATVSTFSAAGALALNSNASLSVGTTFFVNNGSVLIAAASGSTYALRLNGDLIIGNVDAHDMTSGSDIHVEGNVIMDGRLIQHGATGTTLDNLGVTGAATFKSSVTVVGAVGIGGNLRMGAGASPQGAIEFVVGGGGDEVLQVGINQSNQNIAVPQIWGEFVTHDAPATRRFSVRSRAANDLGTASQILVVEGVSENVGIGTTAPATRLEVNGTAQFGSGATKSTFSSTGRLTFPTGYSPSAALEGANKGYVDSQTLLGSGWTRSAGPPGKTILSFSTDRVGIGAETPLAILHVAGDMSVTLPATFGSSVTIRNAAGFGTTGQSSFSNTGVLTLGTQLAIGSGGTGGTTQGTAQTALDVPSRGGTGASGTWNIGISGNAATVTTNANLTGNVTSVGNATTIASIPAVSGANLTNLTAANISAGTAGINISGNAATVTTNANLTGNVTSVGNATTLASIPAISGANLTNLTAANISAGTAGINISGNAATVTTNANLTGNVTSVGNATTLASIPAISGANLTSLTAANISAGTLGTGVVAQTVGLVSANKVALMGTAAGAAGRLYYCSDCTGGVGGAGAVVVSTGTGLAGQFAISDGGPFQ